MSNNKMLDARILDELHNASCFSGELKIAPIASGAINHSFQLQDNQQRYFLKLFEHDEKMPVNRLEQFKVQQQVAKLGFAPEPVYLSEKGAFQVEQWIEHRSLAQADLSDEKKLALLAARLYDIHQLPIQAESLDLLADWQIYLRAVSHNTDQELTNKLSQCENLWHQSKGHDQVFCHNDLAMEHVSAEKPSVVFDWEYAAHGNRYFDIAACVLVNQLNQSQTSRLQKHYAQLTGIAFDKVVEGTNRQTPLVNLTNELWYLAAGLGETAQ